MHSILARMSAGPISLSIYSPQALLLVPITFFIWALPQIFSAAPWFSREENVSVVREAKRTNKSPAILLREAREELGLDTQNHFNWAVCGASRSGKSTMVNVLRGMKDDHPDAAAVGETETTMEIAKYPMPNTNLVVWDLPGCGTLKHPFKGYFEDKKLVAFDAVILVYKDGLNENTVKLYKQCMERNITVVLVRTMADVAFAAKMRRMHMTVEQAQHELRADFEREIRDTLRTLKPDNTFYVSMHDYVDDKSFLDEHEFIRLVLSAGGERGGGGRKSFNSLLNVYHGKPAVVVD